MIMRYHWGLAVGHLYACQTSVPLLPRENNNSEGSQMEINAEDRGTLPMELTSVVQGSGSPLPSECGSRDVSDEDDDAWRSEGEESDDIDDEMDDEELLAMDEMYG
jgi:hypothetical protein